MTSLICLSIHDFSQRSALKHACITPCSMFPHTRAGVVSLEVRTRFCRRGLRLHSGALARVVDVSRRSGWRIRRFDLDVMVMDRVTEEDEGVTSVNSPKMLTISPTRTSVDVQSSRRMTDRRSSLRYSFTIKLYKISEYCDWCVMRVSHLLIVPVLLRFGNGFNDTSRTCFRNIGWRLGNFALWLIVVSSSHKNIGKTYLYWFLRGCFLRRGEVRVHVIPVPVFSPFQKCRNVDISGRKYFGWRRSGSMRWYAF